MAQAHKLEIIQNETSGTDDGIHAGRKDMKPGRPRSEASRSAILDATRRLITHTSIRDLSIEAIAKKAEVGKTTIYRWWPNKVAVVIEAFAEQLDMHMLVAGNESAHDNLARQLERIVRQLRGRNGRIIADLLAEAQTDAQALEQFNRFYMDSRRAALRHVILQGQKNGEFNQTFNTDAAVDMVLGPVMLRLLSSPEGIDEIFAQSWPDMAADALRA